MRYATAAMAASAMSARIFFIARGYRVAALANRSRSLVARFVPLGRRYPLRMTETRPRRQRIFSVVAWATLAFNVAVIIGGTVVRATGSGDGCGASWPKCGDQFVPPNPTVETLIEFSHRASSFMAGIGVAAVVLLAFWAFEKGHIVRRAAVVAGVFLIIEALLGAALVLFEWVDDDISVGRMIAVTLHLTNTFLLLGSLTLTAWWGSGRPTPRLPISKEQGRWLMIGGATILIIGATGALNAIADAVFPADSIAEGIAAEFGPTAPALLRLRVIHPILAVLGGIFAAYTTVRVSRGSDAETQRMSFIVTIIVFSQMFVGIANLFLLTPLAMQLVHLLVADVLWISFVIFGATALSAKRVASTAASPA